ncbi:N-acetyltransferase [Lawsonibacter sp. OA9]|uniref:N-acetyltransferase n=1 Tax=Flintibacter hominis TaxID=2763048 RepID=A0A8J6J814_9FIRM|nr:MULTISPECIES: GNAT family N-acetyltransferase [Eubacteriales]SCH21554.1 Uncharacterised protein [uncultured Clostridium sp.]SCJ22604.1 Uncharacterised protein [uncultured Flavonifractor sp.]MBC5722205.1 N-acetyltransferase [Flintibacter hominis]MCH1979961.1 N-acetyltransferase [Lawsonibacter sp. OA9]MCU6702854.1 N-acetyltransferase [Muriventricola aceti]
MEFQHERERIFALDEQGKLVAEVTFPVSEGVADIDHTFVDQSLRGQGVAGQLLDAAVRQIRMEGLRAKATCSYAAKWFKEHPDQSDLL